MSDLVERVEKAIREANDCGVRVDGVIMLCCDKRAEGKKGYWPPHNCLCRGAARAAIATVPAADEIDRLRAENEKLRAELWDIHAICNKYPHFFWWPVHRIKRRVRAALRENRDE